MKANDFIKKFGILKAQRVIAECFNRSMNLTIGGESIDISELRRFVESHDLVESLGGFDCAKTQLLLESARSNYRAYDRLKQAISDVESRQ